MQVVMEDIDATVLNEPSVCAQLNISFSIPAWNISTVVYASYYISISETDGYELTAYNTSDCTGKEDSTTWDIGCNDSNNGSIDVTVTTDSDDAFVININLTIYTSLLYIFVGLCFN